MSPEQGGQQLPQHPVLQWALTTQHAVSMLSTGHTSSYRIVTIRLLKTLFVLPFYRQKTKAQRDTTSCPSHTARKQQSQRRTQPRSPGVYTPPLKPRHVNVFRQTPRDTTEGGRVALGRWGP